MNIDTATKAQLESEIVTGDDSLYAMFDEKKLLSGGYTEDELRATCRQWIKVEPQA